MCLFAFIKITASGRKNLSSSNNFKECMLILYFLHVNLWPCSAFVCGRVYNIYFAFTMLCIK
jgi:hypothetical protein